MPYASGRLWVSNSKNYLLGKATFEASALPRLMQNPVLHSGALASIADSACAVAAISLIFPERYATTINLQISFLKPVKEGRFRAEG
jgi:uncharacterized protein (TIGR00369 family)